MPVRAGDHAEHGAGGGKLPGAPGALRPRVRDARVCPCARPARRAAAGPVGVSGLRVCAADVTTEELQQILQNVQAELERRAALQRGAPESKRCVPPSPWPRSPRLGELLPRAQELDLVRLGQGVAQRGGGARMGAARHPGAQGPAELLQGRRGGERAVGRQRPSPSRTA